MDHPDHGDSFTQKIVVMSVATEVTMLMIATNMVAEGGHLEDQGARPEVEAAAAVEAVVENTVVVGVTVEAEAEAGAGLLVPDHELVNVKSTENRDLKKCYMFILALEQLSKLYHHVYHCYCSVLTTSIGIST